MLQPDAPPPTVFISYGDAHYSEQRNRLLHAASSLVGPDGPLTRVKGYNMSDALRLSASSPATRPVTVVMKKRA